MAYLEFTNINYKTVLTDIANRKEFSINTDQKEGDELILPNRQSTVSQLFIKNFINANTPYPRILLNWKTGSGKTKGALDIANNFIKNFKKRKQYGEDINPNITYLGFTQEIFQKELIYNVEFGFSTKKDIEQIIQLEANSSISIEAYKEYILKSSTLKKRLTNVNSGGFYTFCGYKEFSNKIFVLTQLGIDNKYEINNIDDIEDAHNKKYIIINYDHIQTLKNGLLICDEIHNLYNINEKNKYGIAIQYTLNVLGDNAPRVIFLSATPITGSATEITDLINLLNNTNIKRSELFTKESNIIDFENFDEKLLFKKIDKLKLMGVTLNSVSDLVRAEKEIIIDDVDNINYNENTNTILVDVVDDFNEEDVKTITDSIIINDESKVNDSKYSISKLRSDSIEKIRNMLMGKISCVADADVNLYPERIFVGESIDDIPYIKFIKCPISEYHLNTCVYNQTSNNKTMQDNFNIVSYTLYDMVFPGTEKYGLYNTLNIYDSILNTDNSWKEKNLINIISDSNLKYITGEFLHKDNIGKYSSKYEKLINTIIEDCKVEGKSIIYHDRVRISGVLLIHELLRHNGILKDGENSNSNTLCSYCGIKKSSHADKKHQFNPIRLLIVHSDMDKSSMRANIIKFNSINNIDGHNYKFLIGSKIIKESYNFFEVRTMYICSMPTDYSIFIQVIGRAIRTGSHLRLPKEKRNTKIKVFVTVNTNYTDSPELRKYYIKGKEFLVIQEIEKTIKECAVDSFINNLEIKEDSLDGLKYKPVEYKVGKLITTTYGAYNYNSNEVNIIESIARRLFETNIIFDKNTIIDYIKSLNIKNFNHNIKNFNKDNFILAFNNLKKPYYFNNELICVISTENYYIKCKVSNDGRPVIDIESFYRNDNILYTSSKEILLISDLSNNSIPKLEVNLQKYIDDNVEEYIFDKVINQILNNPIENVDMFILTYNYSVHKLLLKHLIETDINKHNTIIKIYDNFNILIRSKDINIKTNNNIIGFKDKNYINVYIDKKWSVLSFDVIKNNVKLVENNITIGFVEDDGTILDTVKFKLRPKIDEVEDNRLIIKGALCEYRTKEELKIIQSKLLLQIKKRNLELEIVKFNFKTKTMCNNIKLLLLTLEKYSYANSENIKWIYLFHENSIGE